MGLSVGSTPALGNLSGRSSMASQSGCPHGSGLMIHLYDGSSNNDSPWTDSISSILYFVVLIIIVVGNAVLMTIPGTQRTLYIGNAVPFAGLFFDLIEQPLGLQGV